MRNVQIDETYLGLACGTDTTYDECPHTMMLDLRTGEWRALLDDGDDVLDDCGMGEDSRAFREEIDLDPDRYLELPELDHADHHEILRDFLDSNWTSNLELHSRAKDAYQGSIGKWKRAIDFDAIILSAWEDFRPQRGTEIITERLQALGIQPEFVTLPRSPTTNTAQST